MARKTFFSFHYDRDIWRVNQVRNCWVTYPSIQAAGYIDAADFEEWKRGDAAIKNWIDDQLNGTSVTCVLIGAQTSTRKWVKYEIQASINKGNGFVGIYLNNINIPGQAGDIRGRDPLDDFTYRATDGRDYLLSSRYESYDWISDNGYKNIGAWVEEAATLAGK